MVRDVDDVAIVAAIRARDSGGFAAAYDRYADRLFTYCVTLLRDRDRAADVVHDTFIILHQRIDQLRDPSRLRPWLYAIARNECLRALRAGARSAPLEEAGAVTDQSIDLGAGLREQELRTLVWTAADGLNPREREVVELSVRHGLEGADLASALGVPVNHAHALLSKARQQLERALAALIVARSGRSACAELDGLLTGWDGGMTVLLRKRVARHIDSCPECGARRRRDVSAAALLGTMPMLAVPEELRARLVSELGDVRFVSPHFSLGRRAGRFDAHGFPIPLGRGPLGRAWQGPAVAASVAVLLLTGGTTVSITSDENPAAQAQAVVPSVTATPSPTELPSLTPTPSASESASESETPTPATPSTAAPSTQPKPPSTTVAPPPPPSDPTSEPPPDPPKLLIVDPNHLNLDDAREGSLTVSSESSQTIRFHTTMTWQEKPKSPVTWLQVVPATGSVKAGDPMIVTISVSAPGSTLPLEPPSQWTVTIDFIADASGYTDTVTVTGCGPRCGPP